MIFFFQFLKSIVQYFCFFNIICFESCNLNFVHHLFIHLFEYICFFFRILDINSSMIFWFFLRILIRVFLDVFFLVSAFMMNREFNLDCFFFRSSLIQSLIESSSFSFRSFLFIISFHFFIEQSRNNHSSFCFLRSNLDCFFFAHSFLDVSVILGFWTLRQTIFFIISWCFWWFHFVLYKMKKLSSYIEFTRIDWSIYIWKASDHILFSWWLACCISFSIVIWLNTASSIWKTSKRFLTS